METHLVDAMKVNE